MPELRITRPMAPDHAVIINDAMRAGLRVVIDSDEPLWCRSPIDMVGENFTLVGTHTVKSRLLWPKEYDGICVDLDDGPGDARHCKEPLIEKIHVVQEVGAANALGIRLGGTTARIADVWVNGCAAGVAAWSGAGFIVRGLTLEGMDHGLIISSDWSPNPAWSEHMANPRYGMFTDTRWNYCRESLVMSGNIANNRITGEITHHDRAMRLEGVRNNVLDLSLVEAGRRPDGEAIPSIISNCATMDVRICADKYEPVPVITDSEFIAWVPVITDSEFIVWKE